MCSRNQINFWSVVVWILRHFSFSLLSWVFKDSTDEVASLHRGSPPTPLLDISHLTVDSDLRLSCGSWLRARLPTQEMQEMWV